MRKKELIEKIHDRMGGTKANATEYVNQMLEVISESLVQGEEVDLAGFGKFSIATREAREGINPFTKEKMLIPASKSVKFKAAKALKEQVK